MRDDNQYRVIVIADIDRVVSNEIVTGADAVAKIISDAEDGQSVHTYWIDGEGKGGPENGTDAG